MRSLLFLTLTAAVFLSSSIGANADDVGPHADLRAIRAALPVLLAARLTRIGIDSSAFHTDDVVVDGNGAVASWSDQTTQGVVSLERRDDRWWMRREANAGMQGSTMYWGYDAPGSPDQPACNVNSTTWPDLATGLNITSVLATLANEHLRVVAESPGFRHMVPLVVSPSFCDYNYRIFSLDRSDGYYSVLKVPVTASPSPYALAPAILARAPTPTEMPPTPGANAYYFFTMVNGLSTVFVADQGTTLDVWCPFVLDPNLNYTLTMSFSTPTIGPLRGTLKDNTLHFVLPAFSADPHAEMMGEIDGNPW